MVVTDGKFRTYPILLFNFLNEFIMDKSKTLIVHVSGRVNCACVISGTFIYGKDGKSNGRTTIADPALPGVDILAFSTMGAAERCRSILDGYFQNSIRFDISTAADFERMFSVDFDSFITLDQLRKEQLN